MSGVPSIADLQLFTRLEGARSVIVAGAGGGYDVFAGLPLWFALRARGVNAHLANLSFTPLRLTDAEWVHDVLAVVRPSSDGATYFPERALARWLEQEGHPAPVYAFERSGVAPTTAAWRELVARTQADAIVLVDGGTDLLMRGDEAELGTPVEDVTSLAAVSQLDGLTRLAVCVGFGIDAYHGVCHAHFLENVAALDADGGFLGAFSLLLSTAEARRYRQAVDFATAEMIVTPSIVNTSIVSALEGRFGDVHRVKKTLGSELFINPLMTLMWGFELEAVARHNLYLRELLDTKTVTDVVLRIEAFRNGVRPRARRIIPV